MLAAYIVCCLALVAIFIVANMHAPPNGKALVITGIGATDSNGMPRVVVGRTVFVMPLFQKKNVLDLKEQTSKSFSSKILLKDGTTAVIDWFITYSPIPESLTLSAKNFADMKPENVCEILTNLTRQAICSTISPLDASGLVKGIGEVKESIGDRINGCLNGVGMEINLCMYKVKILSHD